MCSRYLICWMWHSFLISLHLRKILLLCKHFSIASFKIFQNYWKLSYILLDTHYTFYFNKEVNGYNRKFYLRRIFSKSVYLLLVRVNFCFIAANTRAHLYFTANYITYWVYVYSAKEYGRNFVAVWISA